MQEFLNIPLGTLKSTVKREKTREKNETSPRSGRPRIIGDTEKQVLFDAIDKDPRVKIHELLAQLNVECCQKTLYNCLRECNL